MGNSLMGGSFTAIESVMTVADRDTAVRAAMWSPPPLDAWDTMLPTPPTPETPMTTPKTFITRDDPLVIYPTDFLLTTDGRLGVMGESLPTPEGFVFGWLTLVDPDGKVQLFFADPGEEGTHLHAQVDATEIVQASDSGCRFEVWGAEGQRDGGHLVAVTSAWPYPMSAFPRPPVSESSGLMGPSAEDANMLTEPVVRFYRDGDGAWWADAAPFAAPIPMQGDNVIVSNPNRGRIATVRPDKLRSYPVEAFTITINRHGQADAVLTWTADYPMPTADDIAEAEMRARWDREDPDEIAEFMATPAVPSQRGGSVSRTDDKQDGAVEVVGRFIRVEDHTPASIASASDRIIARLPIQGRAGLVSALARTVEEDPMDSETRYVAARWLRTLAGKIG